MLTRPDWGRIITKKYKKLLLENGESMSAYIAYNARADMSESDYTVVSNIRKKGMHPTEAGAYIAKDKRIKYKNIKNATVIITTTVPFFISKIDKQVLRNIYRIRRSENQHLFYLKI